ncbi:MAG: hypothetical protein HY875_00665 [Chloroflexi bacterium]|nr:hypothetical protein [Chloroflexota bacterium]
MKRFAFVLLLLVLPLAAACSPRDGGGALSTATATPYTADTPGSGPTLAPVPGAFATAGGKTVRGGEGTRCWGTMCVDMVGPITNVDPLVVKAGEAVALDFEGGTPTTVSLTWMAVTGPPPAPGPQGRVWMRELSSTPGGTTREAPSAPGDYVLTVFATWKGRGDILFGFYVRVR